MSWSGSKKARKFAIPGEAAALFASCRAMSSDSPQGGAFLRLLEDTVASAVARTPHDGDITVETYGHVAPDGLTGGFTLRFEFAPHVAPTVVAPVISDAVPPAPAASPSDPSVVGSIGTPPVVDAPPTPAAPPAGEPPVVTPDVAAAPAPSPTGEAPPASP